jgi:2-polyprenyl-3-methyl-5-hydroxy-6-metoxy-1,4-benzoquinol methylase
MKCAKRKLRIYEVPISYHGRTYEEGKKIGWKDGIKALGVILHFWLIDDLYAEPYGRKLLNSLTGTPQYISWLTTVLRPHLGDTVLELAAGIGNISGRLMGRRLLYVAAEKDPVYLHALKNRFLRTPNVAVQQLDPEQPADFQNAGGPFDTVLCVNVLEDVEDPEQVLHSAACVLRTKGSMVLLVAQGPALFGSLDRGLGHRRRFSKSELRASLAKHGLQVKQMIELNKIGAPAWWLYGKVLRRKQSNKLGLKIFDKTVWIWRRIDRLLPWRGLSLIVVASKE